MGRRYKDRSVMTEKGSVMTKGRSVSELVQLLIEDQQQLNKQMAAKRQKMATERPHREAQAAVEKYM